MTSELIRRFIFWDRFGFPGSFILKVTVMAHLKKLHILHAMCANNLTFWLRNMFHFWSILIINIPWDIIVEAWGSKAWLESGNTDYINLFSLHFMLVKYLCVYILNTFSSSALPIIETLYMFNFNPKSIPSSNISANIELIQLKLMRYWSLTDR